MSDLGCVPIVPVDYCLSRVSECARDIFLSLDATMNDVFSDTISTLTCTTDICTLYCEQTLNVPDPQATAQIVAVNQISTRERTPVPICEQTFGVPAVQVVQLAVVLPKISEPDDSLHRPVKQILDVPAVPLDMIENSEVEDFTSISTTNTCSASVCIDNIEDRVEVAHMAPPERISVMIGEQVQVVDCVPREFEMTRKDEIIKFTGSIAELKRQFIESGSFTSLDDPWQTDLEDSLASLRCL